MWNELAKKDKNIWEMKLEQSKQETSVIEKSIIRIAKLLSWNMGEAGSEIIVNGLGNLNEFNPII